MFSDRVTVYVEAGRGGDGSIAFRREKYVPRGGPSGGDGGRGGDVVLVADRERRDLTSLRYKPHVSAGNGSHGEGSNRTGGRGADALVVRARRHAGADRPTARWSPTSRTRRRGS